MVMSLPKLRARVADRIKLPDLPDLTKLRQRLRLRDRRAVGAATSTRAWVTVVAVALSGIAGAGAAYFLDPERGKGRRIEMVNRVAGAGRRARRRVGRLARYPTSTAASLGERISRRTTDYQPPIDATLAAKVESELFRHPEKTSPNGSADEFMPASPGL